MEAESNRVFKNLSKIVLNLIVPKLKFFFSFYYKYFNGTNILFLFSFNFEVLTALNFF